jgi:hypothetical protein
MGPQRGGWRRAKVKQERNDGEGETVHGAFRLTCKCLEVSSSGWDSLTNLEVLGSDATT